MLPSDMTQTTTLPLLEQPPPRPVHIKRRSLTAATEAFQSLRPSSLPAPSHIRPIRSQPGVDSSSQTMMLSLSRVAPNSSGSPLRATSSSSTTPTSAIPVTEQDATLLKLVAADTPSHRGNWKPGSQSWNALISPSEKIGPDADQEERSPSPASAVAKRKIVDVSDDEVEDGWFFSCLLRICMLIHYRSYTKSYSHCRLTTSENSQTRTTQNSQPCILR